MSKYDAEKKEQKRQHDKFDSVTQDVKVVNQNQTHNVKQEGIGPINQKR